MTSTAFSNWDVSAFCLSLEVTSWSGSTPLPSISLPLGVYHLAMVMYRPPPLLRRRRDVHAALAKGGRADNLGATMILDRADNYLGRAGAVSIGENYERNVGELSGVPYHVVIAVAFAVELVENQAAVFEGHTRHVNNAAEQPAGIIPDIENKTLLRRWPELHG